VFLFSQKKYEDYNISKQLLFFNKSFSANDKNDSWYKGTEEILDITMQDSFWVLKNTKFKPSGVGDYINIDSTKDFQLELGVKFISGGDNYKQESSMLIWRRGESRGFYFYFSKDGYCSISDSKNTDRYQYIENSLTQVNFKQDNFNLFTVRKVKNNYYFFVNKKLIFSMLYKPFYGKMFGIGVGKKSIIEVNNLSIHYLQ
jgi:hypothetical protein